MTRQAVNYSDWIGSQEHRNDDLTASPVQGVLNVLDDVTTMLGNGDRLPPLWHWFFFLPRAPMAQIGPDGHPKRGAFLPPVVLPRRMFAGARMRFHSSLIIGQPATRKGEILTVQEKQGGTGTLVFVTVRYQIMQGGQLCVEEEQDIVYREPGGPVPAPTPIADGPCDVANAWVQTITPTPVLLFRFSAITFNSHRIHYDRPYATQEEHYPGLVVHGPLVATLLMDLVRRNTDRTVVGYTFRGRAPLFDMHPFHLIGRSSSDKVELEAQGPDGTPCMTATAALGC
ncbi:COGs COG3777 [invertebrate metagenome]|uniref:COGs COG3777 n=1 Tax=invertebrate metagenome TaxID=1711999 RepID=A0A484H5T0_9ZZZZ